jgi:AcrR family transcriptional regulator
MNDTRDRILDAALGLFIERGYDKTSLREIAERVGVTKAALYYHFTSKEEIIRTLVRPLYEALGPLTELLKSRPDREAWGNGLAALVEWILPQRRLFELFESNQGTLHALAPDSIDVEVHKALHEGLDAVFTDEATPLADRVRMAGCIGVVAGVLGFPAGNVFWRVPVDKLRPLLIGAINDVLHVD